MNRRNRFAVIAGSALVVVGLVAGAAFAASGGGGGDPNAKPGRFNLDQAVASGKLTQAEADVLKQIGELRKAAMEKLRTDVKAVVDQAVKDGKITQEQADKLLRKGKGGFPRGFRHGGFGFRGLTQEKLKARLDAAVKSGKLTQEQADQILNGKGRPGFGRGWFGKDRQSN